MAHPDPCETRIETQPSAIARLFLWPGEAAGQFLGINDPDSRMLFRMFVNLSVYGKIAVLIGFLIA